MKKELIEKYIGDAKKFVKYSKFDTPEYDRYNKQGAKANKLAAKRKKYQEKNESLDESSGISGSTELWFGSWSRALCIYVNEENEVLWSYSHEFPPGYIMTAEDRQRAIARGYTILDWK